MEEGDRKKLNHFCPFCKKEHGFNFECAEGKAALERLQKRAEERRQAALHVPVEWPPKDATKKRWRYRDLDCAVAIGYSLCGYVRVPDGHPDERKDDDDVDVEVHGGLTFRRKAIEGGSWFGFDTGHAYDWLAGVPGVTMDMPGRIWTVDDVAKEVEALADQFVDRGLQTDAPRSIIVDEKKEEGNGV